MRMGSLILQGDPDFTIILGSGVPKFMGSLNLRDTGMYSVFTCYGYTIDTIDYVHGIGN